LRGNAFERAAASLSSALEWYGSSLAVVIPGGTAVDSLASGFRQALAEGAATEGAQVRLRSAQELAPEMLISQNQAWGRHRSEVSAEPTASLDDLECADGIAGRPPDSATWPRN